MSERIKEGQIVYALQLTNQDFISIDILRVDKKLSNGKVITSRLCTNYRKGVPCHLWDEGFQEEYYEHVLFTSLKLLSAHVKSSMKIATENSERRLNEIYKEAE